MQTGVKHTCEYRLVDQLIGARSSPHDTRLAKQEEQHYSILYKDIGIQTPNRHAGTASETAKRSKP